MRWNGRKYILGLALILVFYCTEREEIFVSPQLQSYFERFAIEAAARGVDFDYERDRIEGYLVPITELGVEGKCTFNSVDPDRITVDLDFWNRASDLEREFIVFHELGHCFLDRSHLDDALLNGNCVSIMHSGLGTCRNAYSQATRSDYLDELFERP
jgi:hypothetical protein